MTPKSDVCLSLPDLSVRRVRCVDPLARPALARYPLTPHLALGNAAVRFAAFAAAETDGVQWSSRFSRGGFDLSAAAAAAAAPRMHLHWSLVKQNVALKAIIALLAQRKLGCWLMQMFRVCALLWRRWCDDRREARRGNDDGVCSGGSKRS